MATAKRIIITRPAASIQDWTKRAEALGLSAVAIPAMALEPLHQPAQVQAIHDALFALDEYSVVIFVSQNAVAFGFDCIENLWPQFPEGVICLGVGIKTQAAITQRLKDYGRAQADLALNCVKDSESLLATASLADVANQKILICRGCGGRTKLFDVLRERGAQVRYCELYQRLLPTASLALIQEAKLDIDRDILAVFSGESLENFSTLVRQSGVSGWQKMPVLLPSDRVAQSARALGFNTIKMADNATDEAMWQALHEWLPQLQ